MKKFILFALLSCSYILYGQIPAQYYNAAYNKSGYELKTALSQIITSGHVSVTYSSLWTHFRTTDQLPDGTVWDMYSDCTFTFGTNQCGNYKEICDCYNREHSFPASWFGGSNTHPMYTDLFHLYPTDGKVNSIRGNDPFGETANGAQHSISKRGASSFPGYTGVVFEPADEYKGDFARTYFYVATRYESQIAQWSCPMLAGNSNSVFTKWASELLLKWHLQDPVSEKERNRIEVVYGIQKNRNPFIDYPELVEMIWGADFDVPFNPEPVSIDPELIDKENPVSIAPNPIYQHTTITFGNPFTGVIHLYNMLGRLVYQIPLQSACTQHIDMSNFSSGLYILKLTSENQPPQYKKIIKY